VSGFNVRHHGRAIDGLFVLALSTMLVLAVRFGRDPAPPRVASQRAPWNFLIVVVDTLRYDVTSMAGMANTPFIQAVARRGVSFSAAYSTHDSTPPSHFSMFTGLRDGLGSMNDRPDISLAYQLRAHGYDTFGISANGNLSPKSMNVLAGFSKYACLYDDWIAMRPGERGQRLPAINVRLGQYGARENEWNQAQMFCSGHEVLTKLHDMLASTREPFLGFVNIIEPHDPYLPSPAALGHEAAEATRVDPDVRFRLLGYPLAHPNQLRDLTRRSSIMQRIQTAGGRAWSLADDLDSLELQTYKERYLASVRDADQIVRSIFMTLERTKALDRTWVVIVSDHGEELGESGFITHSLSDRGDYESTRHIPMVWVPPSGLAEGRTIAEEVSLADVAPTIYQLAGIDWTPLRAQVSGAFGRSLTHFLAVEPPVIKLQTRLGSDVTDAERKRMRREAVDRLRALGYIQ
jgi:arylsulfatase A-like enzyme